MRDDGIPDCEIVTISNGLLRSLKSNGVCVRAGRYWSFASRYIVQKYITILLFIAVIKDDCYIIRVADCFIRVSRS